MTNLVIELTDATRPLAEYAEQAAQETLVITVKWATNCCGCCHSKYRS